MKDKKLFKQKLLIMEIAILFVWLIIAFVAAEIGKKKEIGYWGTFIVSIFLSPLVGVIVAIVSKEKKENQSISIETSDIIELAHERFVERNYDDALKLFIEVVARIPKSSDNNYIISCIQSIKGNIAESYKFLDKAVEYGFDDFESIKTVSSLENLRRDEGFQSFSLNGYRLPKEPQTSNTKFDELSKIAKLKEEGILTEEEFVIEKKKILGN